MVEELRFDPAVVDSAIRRLNNVLSMMDEHDNRIAELAHVPQPGAAPSTRAFHGLFNRSMDDLRQQHDSLRQNIRDQIDALEKTKRTYAATDQAGAQRFATINPET